MNNHTDFFIYDEKNYYDNNLIVRNKNKSNWNLRKILQEQKLEPMPIVGHSQKQNVPHVYKNIHDDSHPTIGYNISDLKNSFIMNERFQSKLISPSINLNLKLSRFE